jgi:hypothetical protein
MGCICPELIMYSGILCRLGLCASGAMPALALAWALTGGRSVSRALSIFRPPIDQTTTLPGAYVVQEVKNATRKIQIDKVLFNFDIIFNIILDTIYAFYRFIPRLFP